MPVIHIKPADLRDPANSRETLIHIEEPAECEGIHCRPAQNDIDPLDFAEAVDALSDYGGMSKEEAVEELRRMLKDQPVEVTSYHGHIVISGKDPEASPRYFAFSPRERRLSSE